MAMPSNQHHQPARQPRQVPFQREQQHQGHGTDGERGQAGVSQVGDQVDELANGVTWPFLQAEQLGQLADRDKDGQAEDEPFHYRPGQERG